MKKKTLIVVGAVVLLLLAAGGAFLALSKSGGDPKRANILKLAREYSSQGEDQRALDLLDQLLITNADDPEAQALRDQVVKDKQKREQADKQAQLNALRSSGDKLKQGLQDLSSKLAGANQGQNAQPDAAAAAKEEAARKKAQSDKDEAARLAKQKADEEKLNADEKAKRDLFNQGMALLNASKFSDAKQKFGEILDKDPGFSDALIRKGEAVFKENRSSEDARKQALDLLSQGLAKNPKNSVGYSVQGDVYEETKNWPEAVSSYRNALKYDPGNAGYWYELGKIYFLNKQYPQAVEALQTCVKLDPKNPLAFRLIGGSYFNMRDDKKAFDAYLAAQKLKPDAAEYHYWLGRTLTNQGKDTLAIGYYESAVKLDGTKPLYQKDLGISYYQVGRFDEAEASLQRALAADNRNANAAFNLSQT